jgi:hypothetical protein
MTVGPRELTQHERIEPIGLPTRDPLNRLRAAATLFGCNGRTFRPASNSCSTSSPIWSLHCDQHNLEPDQRAAQRGESTLVMNERRG